MDFHQKIFIDCGIKSTSKERWEEVYFFLSDISVTKTHIRDGIRIAFTRTANFHRN
jgi:hypothetical protein